ncbi:MAG: type II secretion system protein [Akkermansiaceae bacterium]|jgi:prepilin-type N-terminal cleavage/methylation domain-containing protein/prepilin-type processing-associated H-X9-DG protein|nr:type II secretion system protein [Akkermansiaceae bacterium]MBJ7285518.1 type II secretion system protein [Akkermansiaceae bacterium]MBJ7423617.1 type II secretion system protein [Akkermansiaceae bacterium]
MRSRKTPAAGFTLTELLVVIVIIATLASLSFLAVSRAREAAKKATSVSNMRQIGSLLATYASDNSNRFPAPRADVLQANGSYTQLHWFEALVQMVYPTLESKDWQKIEWWKQTKPVLRNPIIDQVLGSSSREWWLQGYAFNQQCIVNINPEGYSTDWTAGKNGRQTYAIPLARIPEPHRTPIIAPRRDWIFKFTPAELADPELKQFLIDKKLNILFFDGHVEPISPKEYTQRLLTEMPRK